MQKKPDSPGLLKKKGTRANHRRVEGRGRGRDKKGWVPIFSRKSWEKGGRLCSLKKIAEREDKEGVEEKFQD